MLPYPRAHCAHPVFGSMEVTEAARRLQSGIAIAPEAFHPHTVEAA